MAGPAALAVGDFVGRWTVAYFKPRHGKALGLDLCRRWLNYFLPMVLRLRLTSKISATGAAADIQHKIKTAMRQNGVVRRLFCPHPNSSAIHSICRLIIC